MHGGSFVPHAWKTCCTRKTGDLFWKPDSWVHANRHEHGCMFKITARVRYPYPCALTSKNGVIDISNCSRVFVSTISLSPNASLFKGNSILSWKPCALNFWDNLLISTWKNSLSAKLNAAKMICLIHLSLKKKHHVLIKGNFSFSVFRTLEITIFRSSNVSLL